MLDEREWMIVSRPYQAAVDNRQDGRPAALAEYERLTGFKETICNALFHHRISLFGPPCPRCGKVLRTPVAFKCFECGLQVHEPNWTYLFQLGTDAFEVKGRGIVAVASKKEIENRLLSGDAIEFRDGGRIIGTASVISIEMFHCDPPNADAVGLLLQSTIPHAHIRAGHTAWLVHAPRLGLMMTRYDN